MADTIKIEIEIGEAELEYEGPAEFARTDLLPLVRGLAEALADAQFPGMFDADWSDDEDALDDDEAEADEAAR